METANDFGAEFLDSRETVAYGGARFRGTTRNADGIYVDCWIEVQGY